MYIFGKKRNWIKERLNQIEKRLKDTSNFYEDSKALLDELRAYETLKKLQREASVFLDKDVVCTLMKSATGLIMLCWIIKFEKDDTFAPGSKAFSIFQKWL